MPKITKDITLRTLAGDTTAVAKNLRPEAENVSVSIDAGEEGAPLATDNLPDHINRKPAVKTAAVVFFVLAIGLAGYLIYKFFIAKTPITF